MCRMHMKHLIDARKAGRQTGTGTVAASVSLSLCPSVAVVRQRQQRPLFTNIIPFPAKAITTPSRPLHRRHAHTHTDVHMYTYSHREERGRGRERAHVHVPSPLLRLQTYRQRRRRTNGGTWLAYGACTTYSSRPSSVVVYLPKKHNSIRNGRKGQLRVLLNSFHSMRLNTIRLICSPPHTHTRTEKETGRQTHAHMRIRRLTGRQAMRDAGNRCE